jgi:energy-converting hydrogenase Eha subunit E
MEMVEHPALGKTIVFQTQQPLLAVLTKIPLRSLLAVDLVEVVGQEEVAE